MAQAVPNFPESPRGNARPPVSGVEASPWQRQMLRLVAVDGQAVGFDIEVPTEGNPSQQDDLDRLFAEAPISARVMPHITILSSEDRTLGKAVKEVSRHLQTRVYLREGFISDAELNEDGVYVDNWEARSTRFIVRNGTKVATARQIHTNRQGLMSLPTAEYFEVDPDKLAEVAGVEQLTELRRSEAVEISALASEQIPYAHEGGARAEFDAVLALYSKMLATSLESGHKLWVMNVEPGFVRMMGHMLGSENVHVLGGPHEHMGPATLPVALNPQQVVRNLLTTDNRRRQEYAEHVRACLKGIKDRNVPEDIRKLLPDGWLRHETVPERIAQAVTTPQFAFGAIIVAYSAARAIPASGVPQFGGDARMLWAIDVATAVPYTWGLSRMYTARTLGGKAIGAAVAIPSFIAPYAYFYQQSRENYPPIVNLAVAGFLGTAVLKDAHGRISRAHKESRVRSALAAAHN